MEISQQKVLEVLGALVPREKISGIVVNGTRVGFALESADENLRLKCEKAVFAIHGVEKVTAVLSENTGKITVENKGGDALNRREKIPGVKKIIAVAAGKGGVGKSTVTVNLAVAAASAGLKVGIVDADIYGPSIARMMNISGKPDVQNNLIIPPENFGVKCSSMGFLLEEGTPAIWRGPMATKALHQLFKFVDWGSLDVLFIDMPPGTGDIQLTIAQHYAVDGALLVTTPQEISLLDVRKAAQMFERVKTPILGVVENMSYFTDSHGAKSFIFGQGGGKKLAEELGVALLAEIPLDQNLRESGDSGQPKSRAEFELMVGVIAQLASGAGGG